MLPERAGSIPPDAAVFIVNRGRSDEARAELDTIFAGYTRVDYVLRWAFPETDTYRQFAIAPELDPGSFRLGRCRRIRTIRSPSSNRSWRASATS